MDIPYSAVITFNNLKWTGSSNQANFKLAASTVLNLDENSTTIYDNFVKEIEQYSIQELYDLVINSTVLPLTTGLSIAQESAQNLLNLSESIQNESASNPFSKINFNGDIMKQTLNLFSQTYSLINLIKNILNSENKNSISDKIYVTSNVKKIQVSIILWHLLNFDVDLD